MYPHLITDNPITILADDTLSVTRDHPSFSAILDALREERWDDAVDLMTPRRRVSSFVEGAMEIVGNTILRGGTPVDNAIVPHILDLHQQGLPVGPLLAFLDKVLANPSMRSRNQLWRFVATNKITITPEGDLLFYKKVKDDYFDVHTGKSNRYTVGSTHSMHRSLVDDDPESTCSHGLHVCSYEYLREFGGQRTLVCRVNPADVVSVPIDYHNTKVRVCQLTVVKEVSNPTSTTTTSYEECPF